MSWKIRDPGGKWGGKEGQNILGAKGGTGLLECTAVPDLYDNLAKWLLPPEEETGAKKGRTAHELVMETGLDQAREIPKPVAYRDSRGQ